MDVKIKNIGGSPAHYFYVALYYDLMSPPNLNTIPNREYYVGNIDQNEEKTLTFDFISNYTPENWKMYAFVDSDDNILETDENNNIYGPTEIIWREHPIYDNYQWPIQPFNQPHQINSVLNEYRHRSGHVPEDYFHDGIDIQATAQSIYTVSSGEAYKSIDNKGLYVGNFFYYHLNLEPGINNGDWLPKGFNIGVTDINNHLHFNDGPDTYEINPLRLDGLTPHAETGEPEIKLIWLIEDEQPDNTPPLIMNLETNVHYDIIAKINGFCIQGTPSDALSMGIYKVGYSIDSTNPDDIVWNFQFDNWIQGNSLDYVYYKPNDFYPNEKGQIYRVTNHIDQNGYISFDYTQTGSHDIYVWAADTYGNISYSQLPVFVSLTNIQLSEINKLPEEYGLFKNYPNPFNPQTIIPYQLPENSRVIIQIFNVLGQKIADLVDEEKEAGYYKVTWNGTNNYGDKVSSGIYIVKMIAVQGNQKKYESSYKINIIK